MHRIAIILVISFLCAAPSYGQVNKFDSLFNKMFFNIFIHKPDTMVLDFVQAYFPHFTEKPDTSGWTIHPPGLFKEPQKTEHNLLFYKHPFFDVRCKEGKLELFSSESKGFLPRVIQPRISFLFINKQDAEKALNYFIAKFDAVSKTKVIKNKDGRKIVRFSSGNENSIELVFVLVKDELFENRYQLIFGAASILHAE